jgi:O-antigen/teichoic acid export membrane protein
MMQPEPSTPIPSEPGAVPEANVSIRYLAQGGSWLGLSQVVASVSALALAFVFANYLPKETYGLYKYALSIAGLLSVFTLPGIAVSLARSAAQGKDGTLVPATRARIRWARIGFAIGLCVSVYYALNGATQLAYITLLIAVFTPFFEVFLTFNAYLQGKQEFRRSTVLVLLIQVLATFSLLCTALFTRNIILILLAYFGVYSLLRFIAYYFITKAIPHDSPIDSDAISYGKHLSIMGVLSTVASNIDTFILFHALGPVEVAIYSIAIAAPDQLKSVLGFLTTLFFPAMSRESEETSRRLMRSRFLLFFLLSAASIGIYIVLAPLFFSVVFPQYAAYTRISQLFALSLLTISFDPALIYLNAQRKIREQYWSTTIGNTLQIGAIIALGIPFGIWGVIIARIVVRFLSNLLNVYFFYFPFKAKPIS